MVDMKENIQRFAVAAGFFNGETGVDSVKDTMDQSYLHASVFNHLCIVELCSCIPWPQYDVLPW